MIFCNTVPSCRAVEHFLRGHGFATACCHGDMPLQVRRRRRRHHVASVQLQTRSADFNEFISGVRPVLVCTDIAARGLDTTFVEVRLLTGAGRV